MPEHTFKVGVIGAGRVGVTTAYALMMEGTATQVALIGRDKKELEGEQLDLEHSLPFVHTTEIMATDDYSALGGAQVVVITAGAAQQPGESRLDLTKKNVAVIDEIIPKILQVVPDASILIVSNPVDILTRRAVEIANRRPGQIFGSGTVLDTARFRQFLSDKLHVNPRSIHAYILGEHGDSSFPVISSAMVGGQFLSEFPDCSPEIIQEAYEATRTAAKRIIEAKGATYYAIATVITKIVRSLLHDSRSILPVSVPLSGYYGVEGVSLSVPCVMSQQGVARSLHIPLSGTEQEQLKRSAEVLAEIWRTL